MNQQPSNNNNEKKRPARQNKTRDAWLRCPLQPCPSNHYSIARFAMVKHLMCGRHNLTQQDIDDIKSGDKLPGWWAVQSIRRKSRMAVGEDEDVPVAGTSNRGIENDVEQEEDYDEDDEDDENDEDDQVLDSTEFDHPGDRTMNGNIVIPEGFQDYFSAFILQKWETETLEDQRNHVAKTVESVAGQLPQADRDFLLAWRQNLEEDIEAAIAKQEADAIEKSRLETQRELEAVAAAEALVAFFAQPDPYGLRTGPNGEILPDAGHSPFDDPVKLEHARSESMRLPGLSSYDLNFQDVTDYRECFVRACMGNHHNADFYRLMYLTHPAFLPGLPVGAEYEHLLRILELNFQYAVVIPEGRNLFIRHPAFLYDAEQPRDPRFAEQGLQNQQRYQYLKQQQGESSRQQQSNAQSTATLSGALAMLTQSYNNHDHTWRSRGLIERNIIEVEYFLLENDHNEDSLQNNHSAPIFLRLAAIRLELRTEQMDQDTQGSVAAPSQQLTDFFQLRGFGAGLSSVPQQGQNSRITPEQLPPAIQQQIGATIQKKPRTTLPSQPIPGLPVREESSVHNQPPQAGRGGRLPGARPAMPADGPRRGTFSGGNQLSQVMDGRITRNEIGPRPASIRSRGGPRQTRGQTQSQARDPEQDQDEDPSSKDVDMENSDLYNS